MPMDREYGGSVRKLPSGRYQARVYGPDQRHHPLGATYPTRSAARLALAAEVRRRERAYEDGTPWTPPQAHTAQARHRHKTLGEYADHILASRILKPSTRTDYAKLRKRLTGLENLPVDAITPDVINSWWDKRNKNQPRTNAKTYILLRSILNDAVRDPAFRLQTNPCQIPGASRTKPAPKAPAATLDEITTISNALPPHWQLIPLLAVWCAPRWSELAALRRRDIQLEPTLQMTISRAVQRSHGRWIIDTPKTAAGVRTIAIPPHLRPTIEDHLNTHTKPGPDGLLFTSDMGTYIHEASFYRHWNKARCAAGRPDLRFHDLRGTGATWAGEAGLGLRDLMYRLGHSTPDASLVYLRRSAEADQRVAQALSNRAGSRKNGSIPGELPELLAGLTQDQATTLLRLAKALNSG